MNDERTELRSGVAESLPGDYEGRAFAAEDRGEFLPTVKVKRSASIGKLVEALAKAQLAFKPIVKGVENTFYTTERKKAMYADLSAIIAATQKGLAENGLTIIQSPLVLPSAKSAGVVSLLAHSSGEWLENEIVLPATAKVKIYKDGGGSTYTWGEKFDAQTCGIAITYSRRYGYQSLVGVAAEEDDDANSIGEAATGSKEASQAVAKRKIAEAASAKIPPKTFQSAPLAPQDAPRDVPKEVLEGEARLCGGILRDFVSKTTNKGQGYYLLMVDNEELRIWGNPSFGQPQAKFSELLELGRGQFAQFVVKDETKGGKTFSMIRGITSIANREFDEDGAEILLRQPGE